MTAQEGCHERTTTPKPYMKLSPELVDGDHWQLADTLGMVNEMIEAWWGATKDWPGEKCSIEIVHMSEEEVDALPEI